MVKKGVLLGKGSVTTDTQSVQKKPSLKKSDESSDELLLHSDNDAGEEGEAEPTEIAKQ